MKRFIISILVFIGAGVIYGQKPAEILMKGKALVAQNKPDEAITVLSDALGRNQLSSLYLLRADAFIMKGDYSSAINDLNSANRIDPSSGEYVLSRIYGLKGDAATAVYHLESSMKSAYKKSEKEILLDPSFSKIENRPEWRQFWKNDWYNNLEKGISEIEYYETNRH